MTDLNHSFLTWMEQLFEEARHRNREELLDFCMDNPMPSRDGESPDQVGHAYTRYDDEAARRAYKALRIEEKLCRDADVTRKVVDVLSQFFGVDMNSYDLEGPKRQLAGIHWMEVHGERSDAKDYDYEFLRDHPDPEVEEPAAHEDLYRDRKGQIEARGVKHKDVDRDGEMGGQYSVHVHSVLRSLIRRLDNLELTVNEIRQKK